MTLIPGSRHYGDDDLIRYMDHQLEREAARLMGVHLRTCARCAARLEDMKKTSATVSTLLADLAVEMPDDNKRAVALAAVERARFRRSASGPLGSAWMRAAAAVVLMVGVAFGTSPGRAWVAGTVARVAEPAPGSLTARVVEWLDEGKEPVERGILVADPPEPRAVEKAVGQPGAVGEAERSGGAAAPPLPRGVSPLMRFSPPGPDIELVFHSVQAAGGATLVMRDVEGANAQVVMGMQGESLVPTAGGLEVRNRADSRADYMITIPTRFRFVRVKIGEQETYIPIRKSKQEWVWTINLKTSAIDD